MSKPSAFLTWFIAQYGERSESKKTDIELIEIIYAGDEIQHEIERRRLWDEHKEAALYAWQAREKTL